MSVVIETGTLDEIIARGAPEFVDTDPAAILDWLVAKYEELTGRKLYQGQVEMFQFEAIAFMLALRGEEEQAAFEQNLVAFAIKHYLDARAANNFTYRLKASAAVTTLRATLVEAQPNQVIVPAGTRVAASDPTIVFATETALIIEPGETTGDVTGRATTATSRGNGFAAGSVATVLDPVAGVASIVNIDTTSAGADAEIDDRLRGRAANANETLSKAGPRNGYKELVKAINPAIVDVEVIRPEPGHIHIYLLMETGVPSLAERNEVVEGLDPDWDIPEGDYVSAPETPTHDCTSAMTIHVDRDPDGIKALAQIEIAKVGTAWRRSLGGYVAPGELEKAVKAIPGVIDARESLAFVKVDSTAFRNLTVNEPVMVLEESDD